MQPPMTTLQLPEELVDTLQAEAQLAGKTLAEYLRELVTSPVPSPQHYALPPDVEEDIRISLGELQRGEQIPHHEVMTQLYQLLES